MWSDEAYPQRRSLRLRDYDYSGAGAYFVTTCVAHRECLLGAIVGAEMRPSRLGQIVADTWLSLPARFPTIELDAFTVMPNHVHGIIVLNAKPMPPALPDPVGAELAPPVATQLDMQETGDASIAPTGSIVVPPTLGRVIQMFKSVSAIACNRALRRSGVSFWQRGYYDHIIRNDDDLAQTRAYILGNPGRWAEDQEYPPPKLR